MRAKAEPREYVRQFRRRAVVHLPLHQETTLNRLITVAAAEVAVGLAIIVALYRARRTVHVEDINSMKG